MSTVSANPVSRSGPPADGAGAFVGYTTAESTSRRAARPYRSGAPNVVVIVLDDTGFAQLGCYGSDIATPSIDALAATGVRLTNFHTTAVCSPTRACLLTGRNHHRVGVGMLPDLPMNFPGYTGRIPAEAGTLAEILRSQGYATFAVGKWHLTPRDQRSPVRARSTTGRSARGSSTTTGSSVVTPTSGPPNSCATTPTWTHHGPPTRGITCPRTSPRRPNGVCDSCAGTNRTGHSCCGSPWAPRTRPIRSTPEWVEPYRGQFDGGWDRVAPSPRLQRQIELGIVGSDTELPIPFRTCRRLGRPAGLITVGCTPG